MNRLGLALALIFALGPGRAGAASAPADRTVVVLLFDGLAPAVVDSVSTPTLDRLRREGVWTQSMEPAFPTISLINQVTISTGCWPQKHGIVTNVFLDPVRGRFDHDSDADWLTGCEYLHQAAERQGIRTAAFGWLGRHSSTKGPQASVTSANKWPDVPDEAARETQILEQLALGDAERPRLILGYFREPDASEHLSGMDSERTRQAVEEVDARVGRILAFVARQPYADRATVVVTTDHGMVPVSTIVNMKKILANHELHPQWTSAGTTAFLYFADLAERDRAASALGAYSEFEVLRKEAPPPYWHIGAGPRVGDLVVSARPPYFIEDLERWPSWLRWLGDWGPEFLWARLQLKASHGYPPATPGVQSVFYAWGDGVRAGEEIHGMRAIDVHPTVTRLLGIEPGRSVDGQSVAGVAPPN